MNRRKSARYLMNQPVRFSATTPDGHYVAGHGVTVDFSGNGLSFRTEQVLPVGSEIEVAVDWPVELNQQCKLRIWTKSAVTRTEGNIVAVTFKSYEFRTAKRTVQAAAASSAVH